MPLTLIDNSLRSCPSSDKGQETPVHKNKTIRNTIIRVTTVTEQRVREEGGEWGGVLGVVAWMPVYHG